MISKTSYFQGDSGGPLVADDGGWVLVGVASWGVAGCSPAEPSVYSRVSYFRQWIHQVSGV